MTRIAWLTDIHVNFVDVEGRRAFYDSVRQAACDAVLLSGDVAEAHDVSAALEELQEQLPCPIYFVLGNHDFYFGSIERVRADVRALVDRCPRLHYLTGSDALPLTPSKGLVGHDGWADARLGDYERSYVMMRDYQLIEELAGVTKEQRWPLLKALGDEAAATLRPTLAAALDQWRDVVLVTHVPPWREACWHQGQISDDEWAPHFTCHAVGQAIEEVMRDRPDRHCTVLCGHTHGSGQAQPLPNVRVLTGGAEYGAPAIVQLFDWD